MIKIGASLFKWIKFQKYPIEGVEIKNPKKELLVFGFYSIVYIGIISFFSLLIKYYPIRLFGNSDYIFNDLWYIIIVKILFLLLLPYYIYRRFGNRITITNKNRKQGYKELSIILFCFLIGFLLNYNYLDVLISGVTSFSNGIVSRLIAGLLIPLVSAAIPEEFFYRYILQTRIEKVFGWIPGILLSSIMFSLFHFPSRYILSTSTGAGNASSIHIIISTIILPSFLIGLILGFLWYKFRNVFMLISFHYGIDFLPGIASSLNLKY